VEETEIDMLDQDHHSRPSPRHSPTGTHLPPLGKLMYTVVNTYQLLGEILCYILLKFILL